MVFGAADWTPRGDRVSLLGWARLAWSAVVTRPSLAPMDLPGTNRGVLVRSVCAQHTHTLCLL